MMESPKRQSPRLAIFVMVLLLSLAASMAFGESSKRVALVIGNSSYVHVPELANPKNDAAALAARLEELDFEVTLVENMTTGNARRQLGIFSTKTEEAEVALIYYAGHGIELSGKNYLVPVDANLQTEAQAEFEAIPLDDLVRVTSKAKLLGLVLVDACRDNPFVRSIQRNTGSRSLSQGLAELEVRQKGMLVSFAAESGRTAADGAGKHSPYAQALLNVLDEPGVEIGFVFRKVRAIVRQATDGAQVPIERMQLPDEEIYLVPPKEAPEAVVEPEVIASLPNSIGKPPQQVGDLPPDAELDAWCLNSNVVGHQLICKTPNLRAKEQQVQKIHNDRLKALGGGEEWGRVLLAHLEGQRKRDECSSDIECLDRVYGDWLASLMGFPNGLSANEQLIFSIQTELNRLSCGAGTPDGKAGRMTRDAMLRLRNLETTIALEPSLFSVETLVRLRNTPNHVCSAIYRAKKEPEILAGTWRLIEACPKESPFPNMELFHSVLLNNTVGREYAARVARTDGWIREMDGALVGNELRLTTLDTDGFRWFYFLTPSEEPFVFHGTSRSKCVATLSKS